MRFIRFFFLIFIVITLVPAQISLNLEKRGLKSVREEFTYYIGKNYENSYGSKDFLQETPPEEIGSIWHASWNFTEKQSIFEQFDYARIIRSITIPVYSIRRDTSGPILIYMVSFQPYVGWKQSNTIDSYTLDDNGPLPYNCYNKQLTVSNLDFFVPPMSKFGLRFFGNGWYSDDSFDLYNVDLSYPYAERLDHPLEIIVEWDVGPKYADPPLNPQITTGDHQVTLSWEAPYDGGSQITHYNIYRSLKDHYPSEYWILKNLIGTPSSTTYTDTTVENYILYYYIIKAVTICGESPGTEKIAAIPADCDPPSIPQNFNVAAGYDSVVLEWEVPASDGGKPLEGYIIYRGDTVDNLYLLDAVSADETNYLDKDVIADRTYFYNVRANNSLIGDATEALSAMAFPSISPSMPRNVVASVIGSTIEMNWDEPETDGGHPIESYCVYRGIETNSQEYIGGVGGSELKYTDYSAQPEVTYYYSVSALNDLGESMRSLTVSAMIGSISSSDLELSWSAFYYIDPLDEEHGFWSHDPFSDISQVHDFVESLKLWLEDTSVSPPSPSSVTGDSNEYGTVKGQVKVTNKGSISTSFTLRFRVFQSFGWWAGDEAALFQLAPLSSIAIMIANQPATALFGDYRCVQVEDVVSLNAGESKDIEVEIPVMYAVMIVMDSLLGQDWYEMIDLYGIVEVESGGKILIKKDTRDAFLDPTATQGFSYVLFPNQKPKISLINRNMFQAAAIDIAAAIISWQKGLIAAMKLGSGWKGWVFRKIIEQRIELAKKEFLSIAFDFAEGMLTAAENTWKYYTQANSDKFMISISYTNSTKELSLEARDMETNTIYYGELVESNMANGGNISTITIFLEDVPHERQFEAIVAGEGLDSQINITAFSASIDEPELSLDKTVLDFGTVEAGVNLSRAFILQNIGTGNLTISDFGLPKGFIIDFGTKDWPIMLEPQKQIEFRIKVLTNQTGIGDFTGNLILITNDPLNRIVEISYSLIVEQSTKSKTSSYNYSSKDLNDDSKNALVSGFTIFQLIFIWIIIITISKQKEKKQK